MMSGRLLVRYNRMPSSRRYALVSIGYLIVLANGGDESMEVIWVAGEDEGVVDVDKDVDGFCGLSTVE